MIIEHLEIDRQASFACFVYPFLFDSKYFEDITQVISKAKLKTKQHLIWKAKQFPTDDLLTHVASYLNNSDISSSSAQCWKLNEAVRDSFGLRAEWNLLFHSDKKIPFEFGEQGNGTSAIQLALFRVGVGFLTFFAQPKSETVADWLDFLHYFRFIGGQRKVRLVGKVKKLNQKTREIELTGVTLPNELEDSHLDGTRKLETIINNLLQTGNFTSETPQNWWEEIFVPKQLLPYTALFVEDRNSPESIPHEIASLRYKLANFFNSSQGNQPAQEDLQSDNSSWLAYAENQWLIFSLEGGGFIAYNPPQTDFFRDTLPAILRQKYFLIFIYALHQRFALMSFSQQVAQSWNSKQDEKADIVNNLKLFADLRHKMLIFTAKSYSVQIMQRKNHHSCYARWQEVFLLERLYQEVNGEVREMQEYAMIQQSKLQAKAERESDRKLERAIYTASIGLGGGAIAASCSGLLTESELITVKAPSLSSPIHPFTVAISLSIAIGFICGGLTYFAINCLTKKERE